MKEKSHIKNILINNIYNINKINFSKLEIENIYNEILDIFLNDKLIAKTHRFDCLMSNDDDNVASALIKILSQIYKLNINFINPKLDFEEIEHKIKSNILIISGFSEKYNEVIKKNLNYKIKIYFINEEKKYKIKNYKLN